MLDAMTDVMTDAVLNVRDSSRARVDAWLRAAVGDTRSAVVFLLVNAATAFMSMLTLVGALLVVVLLPFGVGWFILPRAVLVLRWWAGVGRRRVAGFTDSAIPEHYQPLTGSLVDQLRTVVLDPSTRRDLAWVAVHALTGPMIGLLGVALPLSAVNAVLVPGYWWMVPEDDPVASPYPVTSWVAAAPMPLVGVVYAVLALVLVPRFASWQLAWARSLLKPTEAARLSERVSELSASRAAALEAHGAELRRIERDLHDGTQNRLVGVVMHLGIVERALRRDPESALPLVAEAQDSASQALGELREVVRSIYPPVLAERGLDGAIAGLVAHSSVPCTLTVDAVRRVPAAVESAAYFVVAEALTNVAKHSKAEKADVRISLRSPAGFEGEKLVIEVSDDGAGGAVGSEGSGLTGIHRRVSALDGRMDLTSPAGGPTMLCVELPCES